MGLGIRRFFTAGSWADLRSRVISAVVLIVLVIGLAWYGGWAFRALCAVGGIVVYDEWCRITRAKRVGAFYRLGRRTLLVAFVPFLFGLWTLAIAIVAAGVAFIAFIDRDERRGDWVIGGIVYSALAAMPLGMLRGEETEGLIAIGFVAVAVWATDIFAYFAGRSIGGPKLMPSVSPKKTISGALGGLVAGVVFAVLFASWVGQPITLFLVLLAATLSIVGQAGDLYESWIKRRFGVKDSGKLIPGHGGLMDRVDALIVSASALWLISVAISGIQRPGLAIF